MNIYTYIGGHAPRRKGDSPFLQGREHYIDGYMYIYIYVYIYI